MKKSKKGLVVVKHPEIETENQDLIERKRVHKALKSAIQWGFDSGKLLIKERVNQVIEQNRLVFLENDKYLYIEKSGKKKTYSINPLINRFIKVGDWLQQMVILGITKENIKEIIQEIKYEKVT